MATLQDVARLAGVSTATASLALNGRPVNETTRQRVLDSAKKLNYVPNRIGRTLITGETKTIELVIVGSREYADIVTGTSLFYYIMQGVLTVLDEWGYSLRFDHRFYQDKSFLSHFKNKVAERSLDGVIVIPQYSFRYAFVDVFEELAFPYMLLCPERIAGTRNFVDMGNCVGGRLVADLFGSMGAQSIAFINGPPSHVDAIERERGFFAGLQEMGYSTADVVKRYGDFTVPSGEKAVAEILATARPDAVFCANDYMAAGALKALMDTGLEVPGDVTLVGYDNNDIAPALTPALTTVDNRFEELGEHLAHVLLNLIRGIPTSTAVHVKPTLVPRASHLPLSSTAAL